MEMSMSRYMAIPKRSMSAMLKAPINIPFQRSRIVLV